MNVDGRPYFFQTVRLPKFHTTLNMPSVRTTVVRRLLYISYHLIMLGANAVHGVHDAAQNAQP